MSIGNETIKYIWPQEVDAVVDTGTSFIIIGNDEMAKLLAYPGIHESCKYDK